MIPSKSANGREYHVSPNGDDRNEGTPGAPLKTISAAALLAQPGDVVTVHAGTYRESINPPRGGESDECRIVYQAAPGEVVEIKGSLGRRRLSGSVHVNGVELTQTCAAWWVMNPGEAPGWAAEVTPDVTRIWANFGGVDPNEATVEINVRQTIFYPRKTGINYLTVRGFIMRHAATPWESPSAEQIALLGTNWSRGWIIENNIIAGFIWCTPETSRLTPYHRAHSTELAGLVSTSGGDDRFLNNLITTDAERLGLHSGAALPVTLEGNVTLATKPRLVEEAGVYSLHLTLEPGHEPCRTVTTERLGTTVRPGLPFENPDGSPLAIDSDYFGNARDRACPSAGPFEITKSAVLKVWPRTKLHA